VGTTVTYSRDRENITNTETNSWGWSEGSVSNSMKNRLRPEGAGTCRLWREVCTDFYKPGEQMESFEQESDMI
jgi:hypothetical protein